jgi:hypothetical protein
MVWCLFKHRDNFTFTFTAKEGISPGGVRGRGMKLTTYLHLLPRLRMRGTIHPFPHTCS